MYMPSTFNEFALRQTENPGESDIQRRSQAFYDSEAKERHRYVFWCLQSLSTSRSDSEAEAQVDPRACPTPQGYRLTL